MTATLDKLTALHGALATTMSNALQAERERIEVSRALLDIDVNEMDEDTAKAISNILTLAPTARVDNGLLKTIASFLKDNRITTDLDDGEDADAMNKQLEAMQAKRRKVPLPTDHMN